MLIGTLLRTSSPRNVVGPTLNRGDKVIQKHRVMGQTSQPNADEIDALLAIVEGTVRNTGADFFRSLVRFLCKALDVQNAFVAEFAGSNDRVRTLAYCKDREIVENVEWDLAGTPCEEVLRGQLCHHPSRVFDKFPADLALKGIESYLGVSLQDTHGATLGHLAVFDKRPLPPKPKMLYTFQIFAARAATELERVRQEAILTESNERFRNLFDEAPIAYVHEDLESRFISANKKAISILGITPEEVVGSVGKSFVPETPDAQGYFNDAFALLSKGTDASGLILQLRRKNDGKLIWIRWWSRPDPSGTFTRTMFLDITDSVTMAQEQVRLTAQNQYLQEEIKSVHNFEEIVGGSKSLLDSLDKVGRVAATEASVLITGETGTGKELIARAIHSNSPRRDKPLIKLNCAALPTGLVESELFGHEKGAFSGAIQRRIGRFELANGGTIFLDELGEMPLDVQVKLLRVLQEREFERVGGTQSIKVDVRLIAATNRDLKKLVREGKFREDLFYRLNVFPIALPPLRERADDIPLLVRYFIQKHSVRMGQRIESIEPETLRRLVAYNWPGNIRELQNVIERALILTCGTELRIEHEVLIPLSPQANLAEAGSGNLDTVQREHIVSVLRATKGVIEGEQGAAKQLGLHPNTLRSRMKKLGIDRSTIDNY